MLAGTPLIGANEWPDLPDFRARVLAYYDAVFALGHRLFDAFALALGLPEGYFKPMVTCPPAKLRLIHYPFDASVEDVPGIGAHTDYECFTLLLADQPGLEVLNEESVWIDAPPVKNAAGEEAFVINIGDMLEVLSAGTFVATAHRVRKVPQERYSFPLFFACDYHTLIRPLPTFSPPAKPVNIRSSASESICGARPCKPIATCAKRSIAVNFSYRSARAAPIRLAI